METSFLQGVLRTASLSQLEKVIDWLERPWEPQRNNALRARFHQARREPRAHFDLAADLEREIRAMTPRDLEHVAQRMGFQGAAPTEQDVMRLVASRLAPMLGGARCPEPHPLLQPLAAAASATSELLVSLLEGAAHTHRSHRHSRRRRHGRR